MMSNIMRLFKRKIDFRALKIAVLKAIDADGDISYLTTYSNVEYIDIAEMCAFLIANEYAVLEHAEMTLTEKGKRCIR